MDFDFIGRIERIARSVTKKEHGREVLRIAALLAYVSEDVSSIEREVLGKLALRLGVPSGEVDTLLAQIRRVDIEALGFKHQLN